MLKLKHDKRYLAFKRLAHVALRPVFHENDRQSGRRHARPYVFRDFLYDRRVYRTYNKRQVRNAFERGNLLFMRDANNRSRHRDVIIRAVFFRQLCDFIDPNLYTDFMSGKLRYKFLLSEKELEIFEERLGKMSQFLATERKNENLIMAHAKAVCLQLLTLQVDSRENAQTVQSEWFSSLLNRFNDAECLVSGLEYVLKPFFYSHEHICRVFKDRTGMTLTDYLNLKRLDHAADQLAYTKKSILEISMECGVSSLSYFNKIFKQRYGITPSRFRKRLFTAPELPVWSEITTNTQ